MEQSDLDLLATVPLPHLQTLLRIRHITVSTGQKNETELTSPAMLKEIALALFDESAIQHIIASLEPLDTLVIHELVACGGRANSRDLALYFQLSGQLALAKDDDEAHSSTKVPIENYVPGVPLTPVQYPLAHPHGIFELALHRLLTRGLLFWGKQTNFANYYAIGIHDGVLIVPVAVRGVVHALMPVQQPPPGDEDQAMTLSDGMRLLQRKLYLYWSFVAYGREKLSVLGNGLLTRASLRHVLEHMEPRETVEQTRAENDFPHLLFLRLLLMKLELFQVRDNILYAQPAQDFFSLPLLERVRRCYRLWLETSFWNEMAYLPDIVVRPGPTPLEPAQEEVMQARQAVVERLFREQIEQWQLVIAFVTRTKLYVPYLLFPRQYGPRTDRYTNGNNPYGWDFRLRRGWLTHREGWYMVEGGFIRAVITGPLQWLGIVEVEREEAAHRFRLLAAAQVVINDDMQVVTDEGQGRLIVQPNFELVVLAPVSEALLISLDRFADRVSLDLIAQYRLTKASVMRAVQMSMQAETIIEELVRASGGDIPQNVRYSLAEWDRQTRRIEVWQEATIVEVDDAALLDELFASEETRRFFGRRLTPLLAEVELHQLAALQEAFWQRNYLPSLTVAPAQDAVMENGRFIVREAQWRLLPDGLLQPLYPVLDLYLMAEVQRLSERDATTGWQRITAPVLVKALENGLALDYIIRFLQQFCIDGIPPSFLIRLKLWGGGYGVEQHITVEDQPLLRLSAQMVQDLQQDDEIRPLLGTEVTHESRLLRIRAENLQRVIGLLRTRGFVVDQGEF